LTFWVFQFPPPINIYYLWFILPEWISQSNMTGTDSIQRIDYNITALKYLVYLANELLIKIMSLYHIYNSQQSNCLIWYQNHIPISSTNKYILSLIYFTRMDFSEQYDIKNQAWDVVFGYNMSTIVYLLRILLRWLQWRLYRITLSH
jgi:hypothetical protein